MPVLDGFGEHLEELRKRILRVVLVVGVITAVLVTVHLEPAEYAGVHLYYPTIKPLDNIAAQITVYMKASLLPADVQLIQTSPGQAFFSQVYIAALVGIMAGMPVIAWELAGFVRPALRGAEMRMGRAAAAPAAGLFAAGAVFAYVGVIPYVLEFLYGYGRSAGILEFLNVMDFVSFVLQFMLAFGLSFQLPLVMYGATAAGITGAPFWRRNIRYAVVVITVFACAITPDGTGVSAALVAGPMIGLYAVGMAVIERRDRRAGTGGRSANRATRP